jgi:hypothetical protein
MTVMKPALGLASLVAVALALGACATAASAPAARNTGYTSCLIDPSERGTRPLILFFCIQNP